MNGADLLPMMSPRLLFSITIVKTEPVHWGAGVGAAAVSSEQLCFVLPEVFTQPATVAMARRSELRIVIIRDRWDSGHRCTTHLEILRKRFTTNFSQPTVRTPDSSHARDSAAAA